MRLRTMSREGLTLTASRFGGRHWPKTAEGRVLCFLLSLYGFAIFGYVTATLATFFIGRDAEDSSAEIVGAKAIEALRAEIAALHDEVRALRKYGIQG
jgi:voltage-gated potassium channel